MKKSICMFFSPSGLPFVSQDNHASSPSYDVLTVVGTSRTPGDVTPMRKNCLLFQRSIGGQYVSLGTRATCHKASAVIEIPPKVEVEGHLLKRTRDYESR